MPEKRPNILLITTDQLCADAMGCAGNSHVHTPNMDRLAADGVRFADCYSTFPCCTPARASFWTGLMPHQVGVDGNGQSINREYGAQEMGHLFAASGYDCAYGGKWHLPTMSMQGDFGFRCISPIDDLNLVDRCVSFLQESREMPFLLVASFDNPHNICEWTYELPLPWGPVTEPPSLDACPNLPSNSAFFPFEPLAMRHFQNTRYKMLGTDTITDDDWRRFRYIYYRLVERVDSQIGRLLDALEENNLADETVVVFTSDHGEMAGAHRMRQKWVLYEESVRVPLIIAGPQVKRPGSIDNSLVSNGLDLMPTLCEIGGISAPEECPGQSLIPYVDRRRVEERDHVIAESYYEDIAVQARMVRTRRHKYIVHSWGKHREQLFDLEEDPGETVNLAVESRHAALLQKHRDLLADWCRKTADPFQKHYAHPEVPFMIPGMRYDELPDK